MLTEAEIPPADQELLIERVREISGHRHIHAYPEIADMLAALRERGLALGICSNWDWDLIEAIDSAGLTNTTDVVVSSAWVGARKPHPRIYTHILDELGVEPEAVLFVGDTWACDVEGPTALGMQAVYVRRPHFGIDATAPDVLPESDRIHPVPDLTALDALL
jgi:putative hydrolase of the HAD superfamily